MTTRPLADVRSALHVTVTGVVQGVGFRPFVHRLALRYELGGWVRNDSDAVRIRIEGTAEHVQAFVAALKAEAPALARITSLEATPVAPEQRAEFRIEVSEGQPDRRQPVSPDVALCEACERELFDPTNRRYHYPFITCTDCGPRYTVIDAMPYDRERTSMRVFAQCPACLREYGDPTDRRYHSETNSCPVCGPTVRLVVADDQDHVPEHPDPIGAAARLLKAGLIVAVKGLGGFHLAVDATSQTAVERLRRRKRREAKPLAVMVRTVADARRLGVVGVEAERLLTSRERPIVLLPMRPDAPLAEAVAPGLGEIGVMTAYTPLHHLLLEQVDRPLVMTSGNASDEPIAIANHDALVRLAGIADAFLIHDRQIVARYDDSVVRLAGEAPVFLRRARGYAPLPLPLPVSAPVPLVAVGPHLKNTFTLAHGTNAYVSQHIGDLENLETLEHFHATLAAFRDLFHVMPVVAVRDRHPGYLSTQVAEELGLGRIIAVQHHHAHIAAVAAEHGVTTPVIGVAFDGTGYGDDGHVWGAEFFVASLTKARRVGRLKYAPLPGGDRATRAPWRTAIGYLSLRPHLAPAFRRATEHVAANERSIAERQIERRLNAPLQSSMGRLFDAAAAVLGVRHEARYEGQAAMELEALAGDRSAPPFPFPWRDEHGVRVLDPLPLLAALGERVAQGDAVEELAARFHASVARATAEVVRHVAFETGLDTVALGGGVFQNTRLLTSLTRRLELDGFRVLVPRRLSPNDGAISYGQAAIAAALLARE